MTTKPLFVIVPKQAFVFVPEDESAWGKEEAHAISLTDEVYAYIGYDGLYHE